MTAQLGRKAGQDEVLARLLSASDLPGGPWQVTDERTWRTGKAGPATPWGERARQLGSVTGWRSFAEAASGDRWAWVQVTPTASAQDAGDALAGADERALANLNARARVVSQSDVRVQPFPGDGPSWTREYHTEGPAGPGVVLLLGGAVSNWLVVMCLSGSPAWDWPSASELAALQAARLPA